jgi:hypothetical protein
VSTERDPDTQRRERDSFVFLQYIYTVTEADTTRAVGSSKAADDLGFCRAEASELIDHLTRFGYFTEVSPGNRLALTSKAVEYIEGLAWRRHSVRTE